VTARERYERYLAERHRPAHGRRSASRWAAFLLPHLRPEMRLLDLGCGPGSITRGLGTRSIGVDLQPVPVEGVPVVGADGAALPFPAAVFDAVYLNAVLQHVPDPPAVLREARRVARPGAVVGVGDVDWDGHLRHPADPLIDRGQQIREALREPGDVRVGRTLRGLLAAAGFERVELTVTGNAVGTAAATAATAAFEGSWFEAPEVVDHVTALGLSTADEMAAVAAAWRRWGDDPGACSATLWFTALGWVPT
jgi:SAM-dependent methyltransferase